MLMAARVTLRWPAPNSYERVASSIVVTCACRGGSQSKDGEKCGAAIASWHGRLRRRKTPAAVNRVHTNVASGNGIKGVGNGSRAFERVFVEDWTRGGVIGAGSEVAGDWTRKE